MIGEEILLSHVNLRTQVQIGEIKFNFLLPHQEAAILQEEHLERGSSEEPSTPSSSITPTPPPEHDIPAEKPDIPYATLIAQSLLSHPRRRRTLQEIYTWIQDHHAYFKSKNKNWQSSIRHNLLSSPAFVLYGPRPGEDVSGDKKSKRGKDEWGISPEYEGLIGNLSAKEGDTDKLSTKLHKKKPPAPTSEQKQKSQKPAPPVVVAPPKEPTMSPPAPTQTEDKSKLEEIVKSMQGKGVDMGALLQEALAKMKGIPIKPPAQQQSQPPPPPKRMKAAFPTKPVQSTTTFLPVNSTTANNNNQQPQMPITMPMPLPYTPAKVAPIPVAGVPPIKKEFNAQFTGIPPPPPNTTDSPTTDVASPPKPVSVDLPTPAIASGSVPTPVITKESADLRTPATTRSNAQSNGIISPESSNLKPKAVSSESKTAAVPSNLETAAKSRPPRGKKRALEH